VVIVAVLACLGFVATAVLPDEPDVFGDLDVL